MKAVLGIVSLVSICLFGYASFAKYKVQPRAINVLSQQIPIGVVQEMEIDAYATDEYTFKTGEAGSYTISIMNADSDLGWYIEDAGKTMSFDCDDYESSRDEVCSVVLAAETEYSLVIDEYDDEAGSYELLIKKD